MTDKEIEETIKKFLLIEFKNNYKDPTDFDVKSRAKVFASLYDFEGDLKSIIDYVRSSINTTMDKGTSIISKEASYNELWLDGRDYQWHYHNAYKDFLEEEGWPPLVLQTLSDVTKNILSLLHDPKASGKWNRRGLVIGSVQSGKTANYTGLIARAADVGYKFIIVIAGIHNNLRKQTQERIEESFIGRTSDPKKGKKRIGVGKRADYKHPVTLTTVNDDFSEAIANSSGWSLNDFEKPIIFVIKKNVYTLEALYKWLKMMNLQGGGQIADVPMLMIDDEADNASINTNKEELDPTRTNASIRNILNLFAKSCYVGYTATPFANIFIDPDVDHVDSKNDLFPRDFIYCLDPPTNYFGPKKVFIDEQLSQEYVRIIHDAENHIPLKHKKDDEINSLPNSLYEALDSFIIAKAIRNLRGQRDQHCSMMINISRFVEYQKQLRNILSLEIENIKNAVRNNSKLPNEISIKNQFIYRLYCTFTKEYVNSGHSWKEVKEELNNVFEFFKLYLINNESDENLEFGKYSEQGIGLTVVAIGGLSLSRGLTIEGLTVSYLYRNTKMYDTLLQMGRWFGYRPKYEDLCRIYLSKESLDWYAYIAVASEDLIAQIKEMRKEDKTPMDVGFVVRSHPDTTLLVTAKNKMRAGETIIMQQSLSGRRKENHKVSMDPEINKYNFELISRFWEDGFGSKKSEKTSKGIIFKDVDSSKVEEFLQLFKTDPSYSIIKNDAIAYLQKVVKTDPRFLKSDVLLISPKNGSGGPTEKNFFLMKNQERRLDVSRTANNVWALTRSRVASVGDESLGLSEEQLKQVDSQSDDKVISDYRYRKVRGKPLLMLHSLIPVRNKNLVDMNNPIATFGISFPPQDSDQEIATIKVVANKNWQKEYFGFDDEDEQGDE